jgi:hypothetical protein
LFFPKKIGLNLDMLGFLSLGNTRETSSILYTFCMPRMLQVKSSLRFGRIQVDAKVDEIKGTFVTVVITYGLRDWTGSRDDEYNGFIHFSVIAE